MPENKIRERYQRLWPLVAAAITRCESATVYDNSGLRRSADCPPNPTTTHDGLAALRTWAPEVLRSACNSENDVSAFGPTLGRMGSQKAATCLDCGEQFTVNDGGGFTFHQIAMRLCGRSAFVGFDELGDLHVRYLKGSAMPYTVASADEHE